MKVTDFGIAHAAAMTRVTQDGSVLGTAHYLSPEQAMGRQVSPRSDLYSLGVVLFEMLTGTVPFDADTPIGIAMSHVNGRLRPPKEIDPRVPDELNAITERLLAKDPDDRYPDAGALADDLEGTLRGADVGPRRMRVMDLTGRSLSEAGRASSPGRAWRSAPATKFGAQQYPRVPSPTRTRGRRSSRAFPCASLSARAPERYRVGRWRWRRVCSD